MRKKLIPLAIAAIVFSMAAVPANTAFAQEEQITINVEEDSSSISIAVSPEEDQEPEPSQNADEKDNTDTKEKTKEAETPSDPAQEAQEDVSASTSATTEDQDDAGQPDLVSSKSQELEENNEVEPLVQTNEDAERYENAGDVRILLDRTNLQTEVKGTMNVSFNGDAGTSTYQVDLGIFAETQTLKSGTYTVEISDIQAQDANGNEVKILAEQSGNVTINAKDVTDYTIVLKQEQGESEKRKNPFLVFLNQNKIVLILLAICLAYLQYKKIQRRKYEIDEDSIQ